MLKKLVVILSITVILVDCKSFDIQELTVGQNCGETDVFQISGATISPWPPEMGVTADVYILGTFLQEVYVQEYVLGLCTNSMFWNYYPINIDQTFQVNSINYFWESITWPNTPGSYVLNMQLTAQSHICCWEVSFSL